MRRDLVIYNGDDSETPIPCKWVICGTCRGEGKSSAYLGAFTADQMAEDPDFADEYMAGGYDRTCDECGGRGSVQVADRKAMSADMRREWDAQEQARRECNAIERQERLMEGGWRDDPAYGRC